MTTRGLRLWYAVALTTAVLFGLVGRIAGATEAGEDDACAGFQGKDFCGSTTTWDCESQTCVAKFSELHAQCVDVRGEWSFTCDQLAGPEDETECEQGTQGTQGMQDR